MAMLRGKIIVLEGCDRAGKSTHCAKLASEIVNSKVLRFPDRSTETGKVIDAYLKGEKKLDDHVIHLLFAANRWEKAQEIYEAVQSNQNVIIDRYAYSGIAYSGAKDGLDINWCKEQDRGLPKPDIVCFLDVSPEVAERRGGFGNEVYEKREFQGKVRSNFKTFQNEDYWKVIDTDEKSLEDVYMEIKSAIEPVINQNHCSNLNVLWN
jgi:dTMP kinase